MKKVLGKRSSRINLYTYLLVTVAFIILQTMLSNGQLNSTTKGFLVPACAYIVLAVSLNLLVGVCGELSLGHAGFMGIGTFVGIVVSGAMATKVSDPALRLVAAMAVGGVVAGIVGAVIGIPVLRLRGDYLAIVTLAFGEILKNIIGNLYVGSDVNGFHFSIGSTAPVLAEGGKMFLSGPGGAKGVEKISTFFAGYLLIMFTLFVVLNLINSKEGRAIRAVRDNRIAAESVGINVTAFRMKAFVVSAALAGMAGALFGLNYSTTTASQFSFNTSINILVFVVLGGMGNILGSVISATVLYILPEAMRKWGLQDYRMLLYAVVLIAVMLFTWSPKIKMAMQVAVAKLKSLLNKKAASANTKEEVGSDE